MTRGDSMRGVAGDGVMLEPQTTAHAEAMFVVLSDPELYAYENAPPPSLDWLRERFALLESRRSADGAEQWLNWVVRLPTSEFAGYVQATIHPDGRAAIAYEISSAYWGRGLARKAVEAMIVELADHYRVHTLTAVLKCENRRSLHLLERLGFSPGSADMHGRFGVELDERLMQRQIRKESP
jgi:RimJ/RimL family protein N-acetyltransferase